MDNGSWSGIGNTYATQWQRSADNGSTWANISGQTGSSYTPSAGDEGKLLRFQVTASNPDGSSVASSLPTAAVAADPPTMTTAQTVTGTAQRGQTLTATAGVWGGDSITLAYQWQRSTNRTTWTNVDGATGPTYTSPSPTSTTPCDCS